MELKKDIVLVDFDVPNVGYGLAGGALNGPYLAGVLTAHAQIELFQKAELVMGTSVGAANGAVAALNWLLLQELWDGIKKTSDVWKGDIKNMFSNVWGALFCESILDPTPFYNLIDKIFGDMTMEELARKHDIELIFPAVDNNTHQLQFFNSFDNLKHMKVKDIIKASAAIPVGLKSKKIELLNKKPHWFTDGGSGANNPFIGVHLYNRAFPNNKVKKLILIFCGDNTPVQDDKEYRLARDAGINQISTTLDIQEQVSELMAEMITSYGVMDVCAIYHKGGLGDSMQVDNKRFEIGYNDGVSMMVWDYKLSAYISLLDFIKRK
jgi:hypothetical protein